MSTKALHEALDSFICRAQDNEPAEWERAVAELAAIEKAAKAFARSVDGVDSAVDWEDFRQARDLMTAIAHQKESV